MPLPDFEIDPKSTALLVIDMQNYLHPDHGVGKVIKERYPEIASYYIPWMMGKVIPNIKRLLSFFREEGLRILYTAHGPLLKDGSDMIPRRRRRDVEAVKMTGLPHLYPRGSFEHAIMEELKPREGELVFEKNTSSAFHSTAIDVILRNMGVKTLITTGLITNACVGMTSLDAADRGFNVVMVEDATGTFDEAIHNCILLSFSWIFGKVMSTDEVLAELKGKL